MFGRKKNSEGAADLGQVVDVSTADQTDITVSGSQHSVMVLDEEHRMSTGDLIDWLKAFTPVVTSKVRIRFNRQLTWAEREAFRGFAEHLGYRHHFNHSDPSELFIRSQDDSRTTYEVVARYVSEEFVNVYPKAVRTFTPKVEV